MLKLSSKFVSCLFVERDMVIVLKYKSYFPVKQFTQRHNMHYLMLHRYRIVGFNYHQVNGEKICEICGFTT
jgi:hypothetical protein